LSGQKRKGNNHDPCGRTPQDTGHDGHDGKEITTENTESTEKNTKDAAERRYVGD
jgi:hypothetical protein